MGEVDLYSPSAYVEGPPHELFAYLRATEPVIYQDMPAEPGYWAVLRHADVVHVSRHPEIFSANEAGVVLENLDDTSLAAMRNMLLAMDPPRHTVYRKPVSPRFRAKVIAGLDSRIRTITAEILDRAEAQMGTEREVEFVHDVCALLPSQVLGEIMGLPPADWPLIHAMAERNSGSQDPDIAAGGDRGSASLDMAMYAMNFAASRRDQPVRGDLTDVLLGSEFDGHMMTDVDFAHFFVQLVTAGNDTTRTMLSGGLLALLENPEQMALVRTNPELIPGFVEETVRWANPLHYFRRTAICDTALGGQAIAAGEKVAMIYTSANRDETVFDQPQRFDVTRDPNPHLSFGIGTHFCLGVHLARLEGRVFFESLLNRYPTIELTGKPARQRSNLNNSLKRLPVRLV